MAIQHINSITAALKSQGRCYSTLMLPGADRGYPGFLCKEFPVWRLGVGGLFTDDIY